MTDDGEGGLPSETGEVEGGTPSEQETKLNPDDETHQSSPDTATHGDDVNRSVTPDTRAEVLERDKYRCQICGRSGPERGELATLHVHHIERNPDNLDENALENLTTLCRSCHSWVHQQTPPDKAPVKLTEADQTVLLPQDIEILRYLADEGPAGTGDIAAELTAELSVNAVRERLSVLMGLDKMVDSRDRQIVDKDLTTGEWGLVEQIENSARGHIPDDTRLLLQRIEDELVRQALERGCDRDEIMDVLDITRRTTFHKQKRAYAYDFPLDALRRRGLGGRYPATDVSETETESASDPDSSTDNDDSQQRLDSVVSSNEDSSQADPTESTESVSSQITARETTPAENNVVVREQLETAITALQKINTEL